MPKLSWPVLPAWLRWSAAPAEATPLQRRNFINVQIDGIGVGLASAAAPFLPVFLVRLGATNFQVGLLTTMPAVTGLLLAVAVGRFLQRQCNAGQEHETPGGECHECGLQPHKVDCAAQLGQHGLARTG